MPAPRADRAGDVVVVRELLDLDQLRADLLAADGAYACVFVHWRHRVVLNRFRSWFTTSSVPAFTVEASLRPESVSRLPLLS